MKSYSEFKSILKPTICLLNVNLYCPSVTALTHIWATEGLELSSWQTKDNVAVDSQIRPPACSEYWSVHWLVTSPRPLYMEAAREDSHVPGQSTLVMMMTVGMEVASAGPHANNLHLTPDR